MSIYERIIRRHAQIGCLDELFCHISYENYADFYNDMMSLRRYDSSRGKQVISIMIDNCCVTVEPCASLTNDQIIFTKHGVVDVKRILHNNEFTDKLNELIGD